MGDAYQSQVCSIPEGQNLLANIMINNTFMKFIVKEHPQIFYFSQWYHRQVSKF